MWVRNELKERAVKIWLNDNLTFTTVVSSTNSVTTLTEQKTMYIYVPIPMIIWVIEIQAIEQF